MDANQTTASTWDVITHEGRRNIFGRRATLVIITKDGIPQDGGYTRSALTPAQQETAAWDSIDNAIAREQIRIKYDDRNDFIGQL